MKKEYQKLREFLKSSEWVNKEQLETPKDEGLDRPSAVKSYDKKSEIIELPSPKDVQLDMDSIKKILTKRKSRRSYNKEELTIQEVSYLLWATQGLRKDNIRLRTVPSGGAVHPFETYLSLNRVENLKKGIYRYLPDIHSLLFVKAVDDIKKKITK